MALGTPGGVPFSKAIVVHDSSSEINGREKKLQCIHPKKQSQRKWNWKLSHAERGLKMTDDNDIWDSWNWNRVERKPICLFVQRMQTWSAQWRRASWWPPLRKQLQLTFASCDTWRALVMMMERGPRNREAKTRWNINWLEPLSTMNAAIRLSLGQSKSQFLHRLSHYI